MTLPQADASAQSNEPSPIAAPRVCIPTKPPRPPPDPQREGLAPGRRDPQLRRAESAPPPARSKRCEQRALALGYGGNLPGLQDAGRSHEPRRSSRPSPDRHDPLSDRLFRFKILSGYESRTEARNLTKFRIEVGSDGAQAAARGAPQDPELGQHASRGRHQPPSSCGGASCPSRYTLLELLQARSFVELDDGRISWGWSQLELELSERTCRRAPHHINPWQVDVMVSAALENDMDGITGGHTPDASAGAPLLSSEPTWDFAGCGSQGISPNLHQESSRKSLNPGFQ